jgi:hypothetical protein
MIQFAILFSLLFHTAAYAQTPVVDADQMILLGRGIQDTQTGATLTLVCADAKTPDARSKCTRLQWVLFANVTEAYFLGQSFSIPSRDQGVCDFLTVQEKDHCFSSLKAYLKDFNKRAKKGAKKPMLGFVLHGANYVAVMTAAALTAPVSATFTMIAGPWLLFTTVVWPSLGTPGMQFSSDHAISTMDSKGFNWSSQPKGARHRYFVSLVKLVTYEGGGSMVPATQFSPAQSTLSKVLDAKTFDSVTIINRYGYTQF